MKVPATLAPCVNGTAHPKPVLVVQPSIQRFRLAAIPTLRLAWYLFLLFLQAEN